MKSFHPRIENKIFFLLDVGIKKIKSSSRFFLIDHMDPEKTKLSNKER